MNPLEFISDPYNRRARLQPALAAILPIVLVGFLLYPDLEGRAVTFLTILAYFGGSVWLTQVGRERGRKIELSLFDKWGGKPSVALLRHRDNRLNSITKARYQQFLVQNIPQFEIPSVQMEEDDALAADQMYQAATDWLLSKTRDTTKFRLIFEENMNYGFRRNLFALKPFALILDLALVILVLLLAVAGKTFLQGNFIQAITEIDTLTITAFGVIALHMFAMTFVVTQKWVKGAADAYGGQLLAACDILS